MLFIFGLILPDAPSLGERDTVKPVNQSQATSYDAQLPPRVATALAAAEIPPSKLGSARRARLEDAEREFYFWILRRFASHGTPSSTDTAAAAERLGLDRKAALTKLADEDLIHVDENGEVVVAYPFSGRPTAHKVRFESGREAYAMCAIDALGIAPMFDQAIEIASVDPLTGEAVRATITPEGEGTWEPRSAAIVAGVIDRSDESFRGCCPALNFFASAESGNRWLKDPHRGVRGQVVSMPEAIAAGRAVFGDVFRY
jgi:hypothetical protein